MAEKTKPATSKRKRHPRLRLVGLPPAEQFALLKKEVERRRKVEEARLIRCAHRAGHFKRRITNAQLECLFKSTGYEPVVTSQLLKLETKMAKARSKATAEERRLDARRKILLGSFLIAQAQHKPDVKAMVRAELPGFLDQHRDEKVAAGNKELLKEYLG